MAFDDIVFPYSLEAEQAVLGAIVVEPELINDIATLLKPDHFYVQEHAAIYEILIRMSDFNQPIDFVTLLEQVKARGIYNSDNDAKEYLVQLAQTVPTSHNVKSYAQIVVDDYYLRSLITASRENITDATDRNSDVREVMDAAESRIYGIMNDRNRIRLTHIGDAMKESLKQLEDLSDKEKRQEIMGVQTGFSAIDSYIVGMRKSDLVIVAGRPGFGKTSLALNIATNVAKSSGKAVAYFSLEMGADQLASRVLASEAMIDSRRMLRGELTDDDWVKLAQTYDNLSRMPIYFDDTSNITIAEMKAKLRRLNNVGLVIIDYLQLMTTGKRSDNRATEVGELSRSMKIMARELGVAVMCCAQLNREAAKRSMAGKGEGRPVVSDLRESGSVEQDADMVLLLYKKDDYAPEDSEDKDIVECIVGKNRHGETGIGRLKWIGKYTRFLSVDTNR